MGQADPIPKPIRKLPKLHVRLFRSSQGRSSYPLNITFRGPSAFHRQAVTPPNPEEFPGQSWTCSPADGRGGHVSPWSSTLA
ncbi:hypothetical protein DACRYDRAFT_20609 [Dacryopinax primogenitus]|uniref:Uncharacterized protein n=1 Tax=Dacryopinax primogenitus (strain DJM 731) TaxID=1858805 RepID=M5GE41_DACPD|nr:uncharacterized protein DACRYDRAFT_20609 [Dacryopinax primogenitus]EJU05062.1 hypothetical protein DACRYDRAFT_20609 [Dacryopinax primogenitus]